MLCFAAKKADAEGWSPISPPVFRVLKQMMPGGLIELEFVGDAGRGRARLTQQGVSIVNAMPWLNG